MFRKGEGLRERQVCEELLQLPSAQAPELLACKEIDKQYIRSLLVKAFLSLAPQPLSKGGIHIHILSVMPVCTSSLSWRPVELSLCLILCFPPPHTHPRLTPSTILELLFWVLGSKLHAKNSLLPWEHIALSRVGGWRTACQGCAQLFQHVP